MRIFGKSINWRSPFTVTAVAPRLPLQTDVQLQNLPAGIDVRRLQMPPFGTNPPNRPLASNEPTELSARLISSDPRDLFYLSLPSKLRPIQVLQILRSALGGDIWQQWQLLSLMLDSWPMLRKCSHEVRSAVSSAKFIVHPYAEEGEEPTDSAKQKANLVKRAMKSMAPGAFSDEKGFYGMVYDLTDAILNGIALVELLWGDPVRAPGGGSWERLPRASAWVHPRHFTFSNDGQIAVFDEIYNRLQYNPEQRNGVQPSGGPNPDKFLCSQFCSKSGSSLGAGLMRPLAYDWTGVMFNREWMLNFAQKYGNPFLEGTYPNGATNAEIDKLNEELKLAGNQGYASHRAGTVLNVHPAQTLGPDNAQVHLMKMADEHCQVLLLGQTATTHGTPGKLGGEKEHADVKREVVEGAAGWVATILSEQFAKAVVRVNYAEDEWDEFPSVVSDFTEPVDPMAQAQRDQIFITAGVPMMADEFYERHNMVKPEEGDQVMVGGKLGKQGSTEEDVTTPPKPPLPPAGQPQGSNQAEGGGLQEALARAEDGELDELRGLVLKAKDSGHPNGEWQDVQVKVNKLLGKSGGRFKF